MAPKATEGVKIPPKTGGTEVSLFPAFISFLSFKIVSAQATASLAVLEYPGSQLNSKKNIYTVLVVGILMYKIFTDGDYTINMV